jgi:hypothetical protein
MPQSSKTEQYLRIALIASLTLGLAPFFPEPHIWGKLKWVAGGAAGMQPMDYLDLVLHGTPWLVLIVFVIVKLSRLSSRKSQN